MSDIEYSQANRPHRKKSHKKRHFSETDKPDDLENGDEKSGKKLNKDEDDSFKKSKLRNPRAFSLNSYVAAERQFRR